ncbi:MAG: hypothetical protein EZS28_055649, partial [Streblomastix strix]
MRNTIKEKGQEIKGTKMSKKRVTGFTGASITGEKLPLAIIGLSEHPRSFTGDKVQPFQYYSQKNAQMVTPIFNEYLRRENEKLKITGRKTCITVDNCSFHKTYPSFFSNITIRYLTTNTTSVLQPMDLGIIHAFKKRYQTSITEQNFANLITGKEQKITVYDACVKLQNS